MPSKCTWKSVKLFTFLTKFQEFNCFHIHICFHMSECNINLFQECLREWQIFESFVKCLRKKEIRHSAVRHNTSSENLIKTDKNNPVMELYFNKVAATLLKYNFIAIFTEQLFWRTTSHATNATAYPENCTFLYEALSMLVTKNNECSQENCTSLSTLNKTFWSTFKFVPKINEFLSNFPPISHTFVKHKQYWTFNITQSLCVRRKFIFEVS